MRRCVNCGLRSQVTICPILSTRGAHPRRQKCALVIAFCLDCLRAFVEGSHIRIAEHLRAPLREALTALFGHPTTPAQAPPTTVHDAATPRLVNARQ